MKKYIHIALLVTMFIGCGSGDGSSTASGGNPEGVDANATSGDNNTTEANATIEAKGLIIDHETDTIGSIPALWIKKAKKDLHIIYQGASHSRQISRGLKAFQSKSNIKGRKGDIYQVDIAGSTDEDTLDFKDSFTGYETHLASNKNFDADTRNYLDKPENANVNVVFWMWCYQRAEWNNADDTNQVDIDNYLTKMEQLISEYGENGTKIKDGTRSVPVTFVFATGPNTGDTPEFTENENKIVYDYNKKIRDHVKAKGRVLFDFYDIESYDPEGKYYGDGDESADDVYSKYTGKNSLNENHYGNSYTSISDYENRPNWALTWQSTHTENIDYFKFDRESIEHTNAIDANAKVYAAWWLFARLAGWDGSEE